MDLTRSPKVDDWRDHGACRDTDPDLFFPAGTTGDAFQQIEAAKSICRTCQVCTECLHYALNANQEFGVWGGTSEEERRALRRSRQGAQPDAAR